MKVLKDFDKAAELISKGAVGVIPTDTIYGLVGQALNTRVIERIYRLRKRDKNKPLIILINSIEDLNIFNIEIDKEITEFLKKHWPGKISVILPCSDEKFKHLHRETKTLAFRIPNHPELRDLIKITGPLAAPSANIQGKSPASNISKAQEYFMDNIDFYLDKGEIISTPSTVVKYENNQFTTLRAGAVKI